MKGKLTGGFMPMIYAVLGLVLVTSMFSTIMTGLVALLAVSGVSNFIAFTTIVGISPTILLLGLTGAGAWAWWKGYKQGSANDPSGLMRIVLGVLQLILFITLFSTIATSFVSLNTSYGSNTTWIAFGTVITIIPTVLFLSGIASSIYMGYQGATSRRNRHALS